MTEYYYYKIIDENGVPTGIFTGTEPHPDPLPEGYVEINFEEYLVVCKYLNIEE